jgi:hypothetical protein
LATASIDKLEEGKNLDEAIKIAVMAWKVAPTDQARAALRRVAEASSDMARILGQHTVGIAALAFCSDSSLLATMGRDGSIQLWEAGTWTPAGPLLAGGLRKTEGLRFDGVGAHLIAWAKDGAMDLWDIRKRTKQAIVEFVKFPRPHYGWSVALNAHGNLIAVGGQNGLLAIWDVKSRTLLRAPVNLGDRTVTGVHFDTDGRLLVVQFQGSRMRTGEWDIASGKMKVGPTTKEEHPYLAHVADRVSFSRTGRRFVVTGEGAGGVFEMGEGLALREQLDIQRDLERDSGEGRLESASIDANGKLLFVYRKHPERWEKWDISATPVLLAKGSLQKWTTPTWSPDGHWRADKGKRSLVWDLRSTAAPGPVKAIDTSCDFHDIHSECIRRRCEKIAPSLNEDHLRELFGIESYEVMYDRYKSSIKGSLCDHR